MNPVVWVLVILIGLLGLCLRKIWAQGLRWSIAKRWLLNVVLALVIISIFMVIFSMRITKGS